MVYAFDFDGTLDNDDVMKFAVKLAKEGNELWVVTMRRDNEFNNKKLEPYLKKIGLSKYSVMFADDKPKWQLLNIIGADVYIDNITDEFEIIKNHTGAIPLLWV